MAMKRNYVKPNLLCDKVMLEDCLLTVSLVIGGGASVVEIEEETVQEDTQDWMFKID